MRAVWSLRSPVGGSSGWADERTHLLAWVLSVLLAREHYGAAELVTDIRGRAVLVDGLGLPFDRVRDDLDDTPPAVPARLHALSVQAGPFVHLDPDVFLWRPLPPAVSRSALFVQNPIAIPAAGPPPEAGTLLNAMSLPAHWPPALRWAVTGGRVGGIDCSFIGANFLGFIQRYAVQAIHFFEIEAGGTVGVNEAAEGALLNAFVAHNRDQTGPDSALQITYLFESAEAAETRVRAEEIAYTRLGPFGRVDPDLARRIERHVARDYPDYYSRCLQLLAVWRGW